ncbi:hypothetical protein EX87_02330 [Brevibacillus laterosporus]|uniref:Uncharacterized protein n=1 Tax=Brevibacillus laterosporus TaxID=1465 RepID=A0A0F7BYU3_BRELA|nr:hypothetical protein EX87_02330 [Brevibacillus laterosporus]
MDKELSTLIDLVYESYPQIGILDNYDVWLSGKFKPPIAFIQTAGVTEKGNTLTSYKVISDAGIVLHHRKVRDGGIEMYERISSEPLRNVLRREKYSYRGKKSGLLINVDSTSFKVRTDKKDRTEITFRFEYLLNVPREKVEKINTFEMEGYYG